MKKGEAIEEAYETAMTTTEEKWLEENEESDKYNFLGIETRKHKEWTKAKDEYLDQQKAGIYRK